MSPIRANTAEKNQASDAAARRPLSSWTDPTARHDADNARLGCHASSNSAVPSTPFRRQRPLQAEGVSIGVELLAKVGAALA